jgi:hypothetical protein
MTIKAIVRILGCFAALCGTVAIANPVNITVDSAGALLNGTGIADKTQYGYGNNNPSSNLGFLNVKIGYWNGTGALPTLPYPASIGSGLDLGSLSGNSYTSVAGYDYVVFHFGAGNAGSSGGYWAAYYLGGEGGDVFSVPTVNGKSVGGFSSARYFVPVPDGGATIILLGLGLAAIAFASRRAKSV